jgi:CRISPR-associated protein Cas2
MLYVISYDIPNNRRRTRLATLLGGHGSRVQLSVFECDLSQAQFAQLERRMARLLEPQHDQVRIYRLCANCVGTIVLIGAGEVERTVDTYII